MCDGIHPPGRQEGWSALMIPSLSTIERNSEEMKENKVDLCSISVPGLAKRILHTHILERKLYYINDPVVYNEIQMSEIGVQSRKNNAHHPFIKRFGANCLYLWFLGHGQFTGRAIVYKNLLGNYVCRQKSSSPATSYSKEAEEFLNYFEKEVMQEADV